LVDLSAYLDPGDDEEPDNEADAEDLVALKACLKALADALASTNLAVITAARGDAAGATRRVQASVAALKQFSEAFAILDGPPVDETNAATFEGDDS
jgi:hypothetical protein